MCNAASFVLVKNRVFWSKKTDSHAEIIKEFSLCESIRNESAHTCEVCVLKVEITPPREHAYDAPLNEWVFRVDQDIMPKWFDAIADEKRARGALEEWAKARLIRNGENRSVNDGDCIHAVCGGTISAVRGGTISEVCGGTILSVCGGTISAVRGGIARFFDKFSIKIYGELTVVVDMTGAKAKCYVGTDKLRVISNMSNAEAARIRARIAAPRVEWRTQSEREKQTMSAKGESENV